MLWAGWGIDRPINRCPGGGRAVVGDRGLLLADEPTGALDSVAADAVIELLAALVTERRALVLVTHEARFASWADRIVRARDGRLTDETRPSALGDEIEAATDDPGAAPPRCPPGQARAAPAGARRRLSPTRRASRTDSVTT